MEGWRPESNELPDERAPRARAAPFGQIYNEQWVIPIYSDLLEISGRAQGKEEAIAVEYSPADRSWRILRGGACEGLLGLDVPNKVEVAGMAFLLLFFRRPMEPGGGYIRTLIGLIHGSPKKRLMTAEVASLFHRIYADAHSYSESKRAVREMLGTSCCFIKTSKRSRLGKTKVTWRVNRKESSRVAKRREERQVVRIESGLPHEKIWVAWEEADPRPRGGGQAQWPGGVGGIRESRLYKLITYQEEEAFSDNEVLANREAYMYFEAPQHKKEEKRSKSHLFVAEKQSAIEGPQGMRRYPVDACSLLKKGEAKRYKRLR